MKISEKKFDLSLSFKSYTMKTVLPLKVRSSNGYVMPGGEIAWPVNGDLFLRRLRHVGRNKRGELLGYIPNSPCAAYNTVRNKKSHKETEKQYMRTWL